MQSRSTRRVRRSLSPSVARALRALVLILIGLTVTIASATSDAYLHRGTNEDNQTVYRQPTDRALATNVDLRGLSDTGLQSAVNILSGAGYRFVRQEFSWSQFQPTPDSFDFMDYRRIVDAFNGVNIDVVAVLVDTPPWARAPSSVAAADAPPFNGEIYQAMTESLRAEFSELRLFQIGQNLDDPAYWGGTPMRIINYRQMLSAAARGLDIAATDSVLISGEVGLNREIREAGGDIATLRQLMADPEIRGMISVVAVAVDGGAESPYDRRTAVSASNLSRAVLVREAIDDSGALDMPIWFTHLGWTGGGNGGVSLADQARFVESGILRSRSEWPWVGLIFNWTYSATGTTDASANLALVANGNETPLLAAMAEYGKSGVGASITNGFVPPDATACAYTGNWQDQHLTNGIYRTVRDPAAEVTCQFWGTGLAVFLRFSPDAGTATYSIDTDDAGAAQDGDTGKVFLTSGVADAFEAPIALTSGLSEGQHTVVIGLEGQGELVIGGFLVERERPLIWPIAVLVVAGLVALFLGLRGLGLLAAEHVGVVAPRSDSPETTPLPIMPDWKPPPRLGRR